MICTKSFVKSEKIISKFIEFGNCKLLVDKLSTGITNLFKLSTTGAPGVS